MMVLVPVRKALTTAAETQRAAEAAVVAVEGGVEVQVALDGLPGVGDADAAGQFGGGSAEIAPAKKAAATVTCRRRSAGAAMGIAAADARSPREG